MTQDFVKKTRLKVLETAVTMDAQKLNSVVEAEIAELASKHGCDNALALSVQLFVRIQRQFPALPAYVIVDVVCKMGGVDQNEFVCVLDDMGLVGSFALEVGNA